MKKIYPALIFLLVYSQNISQAQELVFAKRLGSDTPDSFLEKGNGIVLDETGNLYVTGTIGAGSSGAIFGEGETNETTLNINGSFVAKYNDSQELLWVQKMGASNNEITGYAIDIDVGGNVYVSGTFFQTATFGAGQTNETTLTGTSGEIFIAKYDSNGNLLWAVNEGGDDDDNPGGRGLKVDDAGNVYVTGCFWGTVIFGEGESNETTLAGKNTDIFIAKYDTNGSLIWVRQAGGSSYDTGKNIDLDGEGNIVLTGNYFISAVFAEGLSNEITLSNGNESSFIAKYDNDGNFLWAIEPFRSGTADISGDLQIDKQGSVLFTGSFSGSITLGAGTANEMQLSSTGLEDIIVAKYNSDGEFIWAKTAISTGDDRAEGLALDTISNVYITGYFRSQIQFGANERNDTTITNSGSSDLFVAKFSPLGEFIWVTSAGGNDWDQGTDIQVDNLGNAYVTGFFRSDITFGKDELYETSLSIEGINDILISKFRRSFNAEPEFDISGETIFQEDFSGTHSLTVNQINTPVDELNQIISYSISPETSELLDISFNQSTGTLNINAIENKFGEEVFTIIADDGAKENYTFSKEFSIVVEAVNDPPQIDAYIGTTSIPKNGSLEILLSDLYVSDVDNDFPIDFALIILEGENYEVTNNQINPIPDFIGSVDVSIQVNDGALNSEEFTISFEVTEVLGLVNTTIKEKFAIYPNPTSNLLTVISDQPDEYQVSIYTIKGELVYFSGISGNSENSIDLNHLSDGIYLLRITTQDKHEVIKLIKN